MSSPNSPNEEALSYARGVLEHAYDAPTDPDGRLPVRPTYKYQRVWPEVRTRPERRDALRAAEQRRTAAMGSGLVDGGGGSAMPPAMTPWAARSRVPFTLPRLKNSSQQQLQQKKAGLSRNGSSHGGGGAAPPARKSLTPPPSSSFAPANSSLAASQLPPAQLPPTGGAGRPHNRLPITPRTYEYLKRTPTAETSEAAVEQLASVITSHNRLQWARVHGQHAKTAKEVAAERRAKTLTLLEALARGTAPATEEAARDLREGFDCLAGSDGLVSCEALHAHLARADLTPCRRFAALRRGQLGFDALVKGALGGGGGG